MSVAGVDGCRAGWLAVIAAVPARPRPQPAYKAGRSDDPELGRRTLETPDVLEGRVRGAARLRILDVVTVPSFERLLMETAGCSAVAVDIPIGLSDDGRRAADFAARSLIGGRRSSVFPPPARALLGCCDYASANALPRRTSGRGISRQTFNILGKIRDADGAMAPGLQQRLVESHPEVSFCALNADVHLQHAKRTAAGREERRGILSGVFADLARLSPPPGAGWDDLYDACVLAWTAARLATGRESRLPATPQFDARGLRMEIVY